MVGDPEKKSDGWAVLQYVQSVFLISSAIVVSSMGCSSLIKDT